MKRVVTVEMVNSFATADLIEKYKVTQLISAPTLAMKMIKDLEENDSLDKLRSLKRITLGGSIVTAQTRLTIKELSSVDVSVLYAMTETAKVMSVCDPEKNFSDSVGRLRHNMKAKVKN